MSKAKKLKNNDYIDSSGIVHNRVLLKELLNTPLKSTTLFEFDLTTSNTKNAPSTAGQYAELKDSILNYNFIIILIGSRIWEWTKVSTFIPVDQIRTGTGSGSWFVIPYACYCESAFNNIQLTFSSTTRLQVMHNTHTVQDGDGNGGYIHKVIGYKLLK